ncbi:hypothetical protein [Pseudomonas sp. G166]|uniref:hypothetical protein n=1 Tax=Pseudomonas sp. G166 TaxID=3094846 RepID=UPI00300972F4
MNTRPKTSSAEKGPASLIAGPWPSYASFRSLLYGSAKAYREALENQGLIMAEGYDEFVRRVTGELDL